MIKIIGIPLLFLVCILPACESTEDVLNNLDHTVPAIRFVPDTLEVTGGEIVTLNATISDESGIQRIEFTYGDWRINEILDLTKDSYPLTYSFSIEVNVPETALKEWQENMYFNDGTSIKITQQYHKLALSSWDKNRNVNKGYCYVKVN